VVPVPLAVRPYTLKGLLGLGVVTENESSKAQVFEEHELRARVLAELHARPSAPVEGARRIVHFAFTAGHAAAEEARGALEAFCLGHACPAPAADASQHRIKLPTAILRWERHGEFLTYSWEFSQEAPDAALADPRQLAFQPRSSELSSFMRCLPQPGPLLVAADLHLLPEGQSHASWQDLFEPSRLAASEVLGGGAIAATDFHPDAFGFVRLLVLNRRLTPRQAGSLVRWLLEIETYCTLALLGLPAAEAVGPVIRQIETELPLLVQQMRGGERLEASRELLARLTALAAELEAGAADTFYRFGATRAYHELVRHRLEAIGEEPLPNLPTLAAFLTRRLMPAIRTCASIEERQENLSQKLARAAQLLRTRVEIELESQNKDLLSGMSDHIKLQLKLQQAVKGVSIVAISYYLLTILHLVYEGVEREIAAFDPALATAISVPFVFCLVLWFFRRRAKKLDRAEK
jgi:uncharacterized membrane-anchored protein